MKNKLLRYGPVVLWMCFMFFMSSRSNLPTEGTLQVDFLVKKSAHVAEYIVLNYLWFRAFGNKNLGQAMVYSLIYAFTDEIHQLFIPNRTGKLRDVGIDFIGISLSSLLILKYPKWKNFLSPVRTKRPKK